MENHDSKWPSYFIQQDKPEVAIEKGKGTTETPEQIHKRLGQENIMKHERERHKCIFCGTNATVVYHGKYGTIYMCQKCYENWDLSQFEYMNTNEHWEAIKRKVG